MNTNLLINRSLAISFAVILLNACGLTKKINASSEIDKANFITSEIENFWKAYDLDEGKNQPSIYQKYYLDAGSKGLKNFIRLRIQNAENLVNAIEKHRIQYESIRKGSLRLKDKEDAIKTYYQTFAALYPQAVFPDVYFLIGIMNTGGTISKKGLLIGVERFENTDEIPYTVIHELIHYQQKYYFKPRSFNLLQQSIMEGSADFLCELVTGKHNNQETYAYGEANEEALKAGFQQLMHQKWKEGWEGWMYGGAKDGRPQDLGYWMGYQIVKSYYDQASDKKEAVAEILSIKDFNDFTEKSKYFHKENSRKH